MIGCRADIEQWALLEPFRIAGRTYTSQGVVVVTLVDEQGRIGRGEAAGVDYDGETPESMVREIERVAPQLSNGLTGEALQALLPAGGARNAIDCALWDLRAKQSGVHAWRAAGLAPLEPLATAFTLGLSDEAALRRKARAARDFPLLKIKVDAACHLDVLRIVREEHPMARLLVDANQSWSRALLDRLLPRLASLGVELIEQPLPRGDDTALDGLHSPIPLAADESCTDTASLAQLVGRYQVVNIKLDKCGGLTEALALVREARRLGFGLMVGNMCGSSLAMAPAFLVGQCCRYVDLDGALLLRADREAAMTCTRGVMSPPQPGLWG